MNRQLKVGFVALLVASLAPLSAWAAERLELVSGTPQTAAPGVSLQPFVVRVLSDANAPVAGKQVEFSNGMSPCGLYTGGTLTATATSGADGIASSPRFVTGSQASQCVLIATLPAASDGPPGSGGVPVQFTITITGGGTGTPSGPAAARVEIVSGTPQTAGYGVALQPFVVRVVNASGGPLSGQRIRFTNALTACGQYEGGTVDAQAVTGADGIAASPRFITGSDPVNCTQTASIVPAEIGGPSPVYFVVTIQGTASGNYQDMWWAGATENGWGMSIVQHSRRLFVVIYAYDGGGKAEWYVIPAGTWNAAETVFTGNLYIPRGAPFHAYNTIAFVPGDPAGSVSITFANDNATLAYTVRGVSGNRTILRQAFGSIAAAPLTGLSDMWWGGTAQNGWGISVHQKDAALFMVWFTYDDAGTVTWFVMPGGAWTAADTYEGKVYRTQGPAWMPYDVAKLQVIEAGTYRLKFDAIGTAMLEYAVNGRAGTLELQRQSF